MRRRCAANQVRDASRVGHQRQSSAAAAAARAGAGLLIHPSTPFAALPCHPHAGPQPAAKKGLGVLEKAGPLIPQVCAWRSTQPPTALHPLHRCGPGLGGQACARLRLPLAVHPPACPPACPPAGHAGEDRQVWVAHRLAGADDGAGAAGGWARPCLAAGARRCWWLVAWPGGWGLGPGGPGEAAGGALPGRARAAGSRPPASGRAPACSPPSRPTPAAPSPAPAAAAVQGGAVRAPRLLVRRAAGRYRVPAGAGAVPPVCRQPLPLVGLVGCSSRHHGHAPSQGA